MSALTAICRDCGETVELIDYRAHRDGHYPTTTIFQVRKVTTGQWVITERGDDATLGGPDRFGEHSQSFPTMTDAIHAAQWRVEKLENGHGKVERGPKW